MFWCFLADCLNNISKFVFVHFTFCTFITCHLLYFLLYTVNVFHFFIRTICSKQINDKAWEIINVYPNLKRNARKSSQYYSAVCIKTIYFFFNFKIIMNAMNFINIKMQHFVQDRYFTLNENMIASHINSKITYKLGCNENQHIV